MAKVEFSASLDFDDRRVVSQRSLELIEAAAEASNNPVITITSTLRPPARQARAMFDNLRAGKRIAYAAPGREVVAIYDKLNTEDLSDRLILDAMEERIIELAAEGRLVSKHCVLAGQYERRNIIDITTHIPNPRDFVKEAIRSPRVEKVITPFTSDYNRSYVTVDPNEPAIHLEIVQ